MIIDRLPLPDHDPEEGSIRLSLVAGGLACAAIAGALYAQLQSLFA